MQVGLYSCKGFPDEEMHGVKTKVELIMCRAEKYPGKREKHEQRSWGGKGTGQEKEPERSVARVERAREAVGRKR